jgi:DNA-directed RNA polymerase subunit RPC12/RpoP
MTRQPELVEAVCARCGTVYTTFYRPRLELELEPWTEEKIEQAATAACPECGSQDSLETLIVGPHPARDELHHDH